MTEEEKKETDKPAPGKGGVDQDGRGSDHPGKRRSRGLLTVAISMVIIVTIAALASGVGSGSRSNFYRAKDLLLAGDLPPESWVFIKEKMLFQSKIREGAEDRSSQDSSRRQDPSMISVYFVTVGEVDRFRKEAIDEYNRISGTQHDWRVKDAYFWSTFVQPLLWVGLIVFLYFIFIRQLRGAGPGGGVFSFGKSHPHLASERSTGVTFADVAGVEEAKGEVMQIVEFLRHPQRFQRLGGRIPRGVILIGAPGTGKTLLAKAIAGEADVPFFSICGSDFVEMFVGVGAARVRDLFKQARENSPCIVFLDEVDAVGRRRGTGLGGGHDEREQTLNAILVEMDGFSSDEGIILVAATNRPDVLDPALLRPGRFDREISIDLPDAHGREKILEVHAKETRMDPDVDMNRIARATPGFSGAELAALVNEAAIIAAMNDQNSILEQDLEEARDKIRWGRMKTSRVLDEEDRRITAYHEAGHALIAHSLEEVEPLHKVTIIPRGVSLGSTMQLPEKDRYHMSRSRMMGSIVMLYGGRVAEEMFCEDVTAGAQSDIQRATELAKRMVCEFGMSAELGPVNYMDQEETLFLGREVTRTRTHSEFMAKRIDEEVHRIVLEAYQKAQQLLRKKKDAIERVVKHLLDRETLSGEEVAALVEGRPLDGVTLNRA